MYQTLCLSLGRFCVLAVVVSSAAATVSVRYLFAFLLSVLSGMCPAVEPRDHTGILILLLRGAGPPVFRALHHLRSPRQRTGLPMPPHHRQRCFRFFRCHSSHHNGCEVAPSTFPNHAPPAAPTDAALTPATPFPTSRLQTAPHLGFHTCFSLHLEDLTNSSSSSQIWYLSLSFTFYADSEETVLFPVPLALTPLFLKHFYPDVIYLQITYNSINVTDCRRNRGSIPSPQVLLLTLRCHLRFFPFAATPGSHSSVFRDCRFACLGT